MKVSVIGGADIDITAQVHGRFIAGDSNPLLKYIQYE